MDSAATSPTLIPAPVGHQEHQFIASCMSSRQKPIQHPPEFPRRQCVFACTI